MIINNYFQQQHSLQTSIKMEDLNNNVNCLINKNPGLARNNDENEEKYSLKLNLKSENFEPSVSLNTSAPKCASCLQSIEDKYIFNLMNMYWHEECLTCSQCCSFLNQSCFFKNGQLFCKEDYFKNFGIRCNSCMDLIGPNELVMRIDHLNTKQLIYYHLNCFKCLVCEKHLQKGEEYIMRPEGIYCKLDFERNGLKNIGYGQHKINSNSNSSFNSQPSEEENSVDSIKYRMVLANQSQNEQIPKKSSNRRVTKRPRTILNAAQRYDFREAFKQSQKPCRKVREHLADKTGLTVRVVQVWFQNERAKMKKMQRRQQQMNKFGDMGLNNGKKKNSKKSKKDGMSNDEDESDDEDSDVDTEDLSEDDEESLDLDETESQMNAPNTSSLTEQQNFANLQFCGTDNLMMGGNFQHQQQNENDYMNLQYAQHQQQQQQQCQIPHNPINRLYSMQNSYF
ncbi:unnamed protein product [Brachionus calyciflorus]|uniref:Uncharacterized protein n=1 Tax=Brachionus calyciflorus TaxID=104777 RepID=A0A814JZK3_9BILA|nr:unnamed protein product [Brachionus calyciflorus]